MSTTVFSYKLRKLFMLRSNNVNVIHFNERSLSKCTKGVTDGTEAMLLGLMSIESVNANYLKYDSLQFKIT